MNSLLNDFDAEQAILGAILLDYRRVMELLALKHFDADMFEARAHRVIFNTMLVMHKAGKCIDTLTLEKRLDDKHNLEDAGGVIFINKLVDCIPTVAHTEGYVDIVIEKYRLRCLRDCYCDMQREMEGGSTSQELISSLMSNMTKHIDIKEGSDPVALHSKSLQEAEDANMQGKPAGIPSFLSALTDTMGYYIPETMYLIAGRPSDGKCLGMGTKILMFDGSHKKVEDIISGDKLMGPDSLPRNVVTTTVGRGEMFQVKPRRGLPFVCNRDHVLPIIIYGERRDLTVNECVSASKKFKIKSRLYRVGVEFAEKKVLIDPYWLGAWLGDGSSHSAGITNIDSEIIRYIYDYANLLGMFITKTQNKTDKIQPVFTYNIVGYKRKKDGQFIPHSHTENKLKELLKNYNLLRNKHIPKDYLINCRSIRLSLLAGLIDTDGSKLKRGNCRMEISQSRKVMADDICFLARSLGFYVNIYYREKTRSYRLYISGNISEIPVLIKRKQALKQKFRKDVSLTGFDIVDIGRDNYYGFTLQEADGLFLLEDFTVSHNTSMASAEAIHSSVILKIPTAFVSMEMSEKLLREQMAGCIANVSSFSFRRGLYSPAQRTRMIQAFDLLSKAPLFINDERMTIEQTVAWLSNMVSKHGIRLVILDYIQLIKASKGTGNLGRTEQVMNWSGDLKAFGKKAGITMIALSQLSRQGIKLESNTPAAPMLESLRDSGSLEQDSDVVLFIFKKPGEPMADFFSDKDWPMECSISKNRIGPTGRIPLLFVRSRQRFQVGEGQEFDWTKQMRPTETQGELT